MEKLNRNRYLKVIIPLVTLVLINGSQLWANDGRILVCNYIPFPGTGNQVIITPLGAGAYDLELIELTYAGPVPIDSRRVRKSVRFDTMTFLGSRTRFLVVLQHGGALIGSLDMVINYSGSDRRFLLSNMLCNFENQNSPE